MSRNTCIRWGLAVVLFVGMTGFVFAQQTSKTEENSGKISTQMMGPEMMGSGMCPMMVGGTRGSMMGSQMMGTESGEGHHTLAERSPTSFWLQHRAELKLTPEQIEKLEALHTDFRKEAIRRSADRQVAELELETLLRKEPVDLTQIEAKTKQIATLEAEGQFARIKTQEQGKALLSPEQRQESETLSQTGKAMPGASGRPLMSRHMARMMEMMGQMGSMMGGQHGMMAPAKGHMTEK